MLVTAAVFQSAIEPYVVVAVTGLVTHAVAAAATFALVMAVCAATCAGRKRSSARPARRCDRIARAHLHTSDTTRRNADVLQRGTYVLHRGATHSAKLQHYWMRRTRVTKSQDEKRAVHTILLRAALM